MILQLAYISTSFFTIVHHNDLQFIISINRLHFMFFNPIFHLLLFVTELAYTIEVNEKCDVYSFVVLSLEILLGKHPGDIVSTMLQSSSVGQTIDAVLLTDMLDQRLPFPTNDIKKELVSIIRIAFHCLTESPHSRPTMDQVCKEIVISKSSSRV